MKKYFIFLLYFLSIFSMTSCKDMLQDLNTDTEKLGETDPRYVFTGATSNWNNASRAHLTGKYDGVMQLMQYLVSASGAPDGIYANTTRVTNPAPYVPYYGDYFNGNIGLRLRYLVNTVIEYNAEKEKYSDLAAIARMLEAYEAWLMFDVYGAAPYSEAFKVDEGIKTPVYDLYKDKYKEFDQIVKKSVDDLSSTAKAEQYPLGTNDFFYKGDISKWIRFGNSLRIKMAQRLEKADAAHYNAVVTEALAHPGGIISNNAESCVYYHANDYNNNTDDMHILTYQYCASRAFVSFLKGNNDPRLKLLVRPNGFGKNNNNVINDRQADTLAKYYPNYQTQYPLWAERFVGMSANLDSANSTRQRAYYSFVYGSGKTVSIRVNSQIESRYYVKNGGRIGTQVTERDKEDAKYDYNQDNIKLFSPQITYPDVCFMMAEIAFKAGAVKGGKSAEEWYLAGIRASMELYQSWGDRIKVPAAIDMTSDNYDPVTTADIDAYTAQAGILPVTLDKIISQAWVNSFMRPEEAWATWKRTGLPAFRDNPASSGGVAYLETIKGDGTRLIPRRQIVPTPNSANSVNFNAAVTKLMEDLNYGTNPGSTQGRIWWDKP